MKYKKNKILQKAIKKRENKNQVNLDNENLDKLILALQETEMDFRDWLPELKGEKTTKFPLNKVIQAAQAERDRFLAILKKINYKRRKKYEEKLLEMDRILEKAREFLAK